MKIVRDQPERDEEWWARKSDEALNPDPYAGQLERCGLCGKRMTMEQLDYYHRCGMRQEGWKP